MEIQKIVKQLDIQLFQKELVEWFLQNKRDLPWRKDKNPYKVWVSEIMLQQTRVDTVIPYFENFISKFNTVYDLAEAEEEDVLKAWEGLGYYSRARNLQTAVKEVVEKYEGVVPNNEKEILSLKGIGPYTSGAILSIAYDKPVPAVDGNVMRVFSRLFALDDDIAKQKTRKKIEAIVKDVIDESCPGDFNQAIMELGALICTPQSPSCMLCPVVGHCKARKLGIEQTLPIKKRKIKVKEVLLMVGLLQNEKGQFIVEKRPDTGLLAKLWEFPNVSVVRKEKGEAEKLKRVLEDTYEVKVKEIVYQYDFEHIFSHLKWKVSVYTGTFQGNVVENEKRKIVTKEELMKLPFPVPYQKVIEKNILN